MKRTLVIGSAVIDVIIRLPFIPESGEDINIPPPLYRLGGCACNVFEALRFLDSPALLCSPVGKGVYGNMVREFLAERGTGPLVNLEEENGCCFCLVEENGERSFLSHHGAEYLFSKAWIPDNDSAGSGSVYISGLEVEEPTGGEIIAFVYDHPELELFFAPGPRITRVQPERMDAILARRDAGGKGPLLHLNEKEARSFSGFGSVEAAARRLAERTENALVITLGKNGCYCYDAASGGAFVPGFPGEAKDTTGAGDVHCGAVIAGLTAGLSLPKTCEIANRLGAAVVGMYGVALFGKPELVALKREITALWKV